MTQMNASALQDNLSNPQKTYLWDVIIPNPIGGGDADTLMLRCQSTNRPGRSVGKILLPYKQSAGVSYPGKLTYSHTWDCTFVEGEDKATWNIIYSWMQKVIHDKTNIGTGDILIKSDIYIKLLGTAGAETLKIRLVGCYPESTPDIPLSYDDEGNVMHPVTWSYDRWEEA